MCNFYIFVLAPNTHCNLLDKPRYVGFEWNPIGLAF